MQLEHTFTVPVPVAQAWEVLLDVERIAPCMPGATVEAFDGETIDGKVKVKVGPIPVSYAGTAKFVEKDAGARRAVIDARAKEARGTGTAAATITAVLTESDSSTDVVVTTDLQITGKPAQFGRGVMVEVGNKLLGKFADCLADELSGGSAPATDAPAAAASGAPAAPAASDAPAGGQTAAAASDIASSTSAAAPQATTPPPSLRRLPDDDAIDLLDTAGPAVLKRLAPVLAGLVLLLLLWRLRSRRRD
jgi:carbon monoxide dehydrogenase subunit G